MNTNETQQVMKVNDPYLSVYEYTGKSSGYNNVGKEVNEAAQKAGIKTIWKDLPEDMQRETYKQVATYPKSFLDQHFGNNNIVVDKNFLLLLHEKLITLENKFDQLLKKLDNNITDNKEEDDDLPF
jgi:hypothetical protein